MIGWNYLMNSTLLEASNGLALEKPLANTVSRSIPGMRSIALIPLWGFLSSGERA